MHIETVMSTEFRSVDSNPAVIQFRPTFIGLVGANASGNTAVLQALRRLLGVTWLAPAHDHASQAVRDLHLRTGARIAGVHRSAQPSSGDIQCAQHLGCVARIQGA